jgi:outer membrane immunogenic protein
MRHLTIVLLGATALSIACAPAALAADMPVKASYQAPAWSWTGFYAGLNAGYGWGSQSVKMTGDPAVIQPVLLSPAGVNSLAGDAKGFLGGGQLGYNWQSGRLVYGLEADLDAAHISSSQDIGAFLGLARTFHGEQKLDWLGTFRGRLGYTPADRLLVYATGGLAVGHASATANLSTDLGCVAGVCVSSSSSKTLAGWTAGAGVEYALMGNWSVKAEYLYYDLGHVSSSGSWNLFPIAQVFGEVAVRGSVARLGVNYKLN